MNISSFIKNDIKTRIQNGEPMPMSLTLNDLARHYDVSITPVRKALSILVDDGFLIRRDNNRLEINKKKIGQGELKETLEFPHQSKEWDQVLLDEVMLASLSLVAVYLREKTMADKYNIGRSIIRHVFNRFAGAGLIEHIPRRGWRVNPFREEEMEAYLVVREVLEIKAFDLAIPNIKNQEINNILDGNVQALNNSLHRYLIESSGNKYIKEFFQQYIARYYTKLFYYAAPETAVVDEMSNQHRLILESLLIKDYKTARSELSKHILAQKVVLRKLITKHN
jgi:DNA-binding GntR family transcriptional regulator